MNIRIFDNYELRPTKGGLDWQLHEFKEVEKKDGSKAAEWVDLPAYFGSIEPALRYVAQRVPRTQYKAVQADLEGAVDELRAIAREIGKHARAFERAMKEEKCN